MDDLKVALEELKEESDSGVLEAAGAPRSRCSRQTLVDGCAGSPHHHSRSAWNHSLVLAEPIPSNTGRKLN